MHAVALRNRISPESLVALYVVFLARKDDLLALEARRTIYRFVEDYPGVHLREVARGTGMDPNHVKYHLTHLERHGLVSGRKEEGYWRFWPKERSDLGRREVVAPDDKRVLALLRRPVPLHVTLLLLDRGETNQKDLVAAVGVAQSTLSYHLKRMERDGLVQVHREGKERRFALVDPGHVEALLLRYRPPDALVQGFLDAWEQLEL